jgi:flavorubredoxin
MSPATPAPLELVPGLVLLGACWEVPFRGQTIHSTNAAYMIEGDRYAMLVEGGHPKDVAVVEEQVRRRLAQTGLELRFVFTSHEETPHSASAGRILAAHPGAELVGGVGDFHLIFPQHADRLRPLRPGDALDLGGTEFVVLEAVIKDLASTLWGFDTRTATLFPGDGFAFAHYHDAGMCGRWTDEVPGLPVAAMAARFAENALYWTTMTAMAPFVDRLDEQLATLGVRIVAPTHGLPIRDIAGAMPAIRAGLEGQPAG